MAATLSFTFWQPRRQTRVADATTRCRPRRMRTSAITCPPQANVNFQVKTFRLYGKLRKTSTEVHNSLPSIETIQTEKSLMSFDEKRHSTPENADYGEFYRGLASSITPLPQSRGLLDTRRSSRSLTSSTRSLDVRQSTFFTLTPAPLTSQSARSAADSSSTQPVLPRLSVSSYAGLRTPGTSSRGGQSVVKDKSSVSGSKSTTTGSKALSVQTGQMVE